MNRCVHQSPWGCLMLRGSCRLGCDKFEPVRDIHVSSNAAEETLTERLPDRGGARPFVRIESVGGAPALVVGVKGTF